jgi:hypothetical protein
MASVAAFESFDKSPHVEEPVEAIEMQDLHV